MNDPPRTRRRVVEAPGRKPAVKLHAVRVIAELDPNPDPSYLEQDEFKDRRAAYYERDEFSLICIYAEAEVWIEGVAQTLTSAGLYGIESDSEREYFDEIRDQEWASLRNILKAVGVSTDQLPLEAKREWTEWRT